MIRYKFTMKKLISALVVSTFVGAFIGACSTSNSKSDGGHASASTGEASDLTWTDAKARKARVSDVKYALTVRLNDTDLKYSGSNTIRFQLSDNAKPLRVDFFEGQVTKITANGNMVPITTAKKKYQIDLPAEALKTGANEVTIEFIQDYSRQGVGLHRFQDPETKEVFTYTDFEPYDANRFFPCFDQPDLRAALTLHVEAPAAWVVIANETETSVKTGADKRKTWTFPETPPIATYIFALHAGPYQVWKDNAGDIPLRLLARPSMAKYMRANEFFKVTKQGFKYFNDFFGVKYPFKKYDQIFVPEFNSGAMENVAAVTFSENYLTRSAPTRDQRRSAGSVILHEMAHMWFGNLVTMAWWNDLWLNESFATVMATMGLAEGTEYKEAWQSFFADMKNWAYWEDSLVTTHPIEAPVANVKDAFAIFDGITYGKGASVLKQLRYYIGNDAFKAGIQHYMKTHAYQNTELKDFIAALQTKTNKDLNAWAAVWLRQSGTDSLAAQWTCTDGKLAQVTLHTKPTAGAQFRPQTVLVGMYKRQKSQLQRVHTVRVDLQSPEQKVSGSWTCPDFVYPNDEDYGFASVVLDPKSLAFARDHLALVNDQLMRTMIWHDLWEMVRNGRMPLQKYVEIVDAQLPKEKNIIILSSVVGSITSGRASVIQYWPIGRQAELEAFIKRYEEILFARFKKEKAGSDEQKFWFDNYVSLARTDKSLAQLATWSKQKDIAPGFPLDLDRRWGILRQIARFAPTPPVEGMEELKKTDTSDRGVRGAMTAEAIQPVPAIKQKWMTELMQVKPKHSLAEARAVMGTLFPPEQAKLVMPFEDKFYSFIRERSQPEHDIYMRQFAARLTPLNCDPAQSSKLKSFIERQKLTPVVTKALKVNLQEDERCQMIRAKAGQ